MKEVKIEIIVNNLKDSKYYNDEITIIRDGEERHISQKLLMKGDIMTTDKDHADYLIKCGYAQLVKESKETKENE